LNASIVYLGFMGTFIIGVIVGAAGITFMRRFLTNRQLRDNKDTMDTADRTK